MGIRLTEYVFDVTGFQRNAPANVAYARVSKKTIFFRAEARVLFWKVEIHFL